MDAEYAKTLKRFYLKFLESRTLCNKTPIDVENAYPTTPQHVAAITRPLLLVVFDFPANAAAVDAPPIAAFEATQTSSVLKGNILLDQFLALIVGGKNLIAVNDPKHNVKAWIKSEINAKAIHGMPYAIALPRFAEVPIAANSK